MQAAMIRLAFSSARLVISTPASGSIAALAKVNSIVQATYANSRRSSSTPRTASRTGPATFAGAGTWVRFANDRSAISAGTHISAASQNTACVDTQVPHTPISTAPTALPIAANRALRPSRSATAAALTRPSVNAASAGFNMQLANPCIDCASSTGQSAGDHAINIALAPIPTNAAAAATALLRSASTSIPAGTCASIADADATPRAKPNSACVQLWLVRYTATNGPNPVCRSATKKNSQFSPCNSRCGATQEAYWPLSGAPSIATGRPAM